MSPEELIDWYKNITAEIKILEAQKSAILQQAHDLAKVAGGRLQVDEEWYFEIKEFDAKEINYLRKPYTATYIRSKKQTDEEALVTKINKGEFVDGKHS